LFELKAQDSRAAVRHPEADGAGWPRTPSSISISADCRADGTDRPEDFIAFALMANLVAGDGRAFELIRGICDEDEDVSFFSDGEGVRRREPRQEEWRGLVPLYFFSRSCVGRFSGPSSSTESYCDDH